MLHAIAANQFISPNWHVMFIHYPIAFLTLGLLIELCSFCWPRGSFRAAGRWMLLLGTLLALPTLMVGLYALRDAAVAGPPQPAMVPWYRVTGASLWSPDQWRFMSRHVWLNSFGVGLAVVGVVAWIAGSDQWRRRLYWPILVLLVCVVGIFVTGAWYGGESVYRFGTAVELPGAPAAPRLSLHEHPELVAGEHAEHEHRVAGVRDVRYYIPPLELHVALAGFAVALAAAAMGLTIRRWERRDIEQQASEPIPAARDYSGAPAPVSPDASNSAEITPGPGEPEVELPLSDAPAMEAQSLGPYGTVEVAVPVDSGPVYYPGRFWMLAFLLTLGTALAGLWSVIGVFTGPHLARDKQMLAHPDHRRLLLHTIFGVCLIVLPLILAALVRFGRRQRAVAAIVMALWALILAMQLWLGIAMLFDGHEGPLFHFNRPVAAAL